MPKQQYPRAPDPNRVSIISVIQATKFRVLSEEDAPEVKGDNAEYHELWAVTLKTPRFEFKVIRGPIIGIKAEYRFTCACYLKKSEIRP